MSGVVDEDAAWSVFELARWAGRPESCPHCCAVGRCYFLAPREGQRRTRLGSSTARRVWKCGACRRQFSVLTGSVLEGTRIPLGQWLHALEAMCGGSRIDYGVVAPAARRRIDAVLSEALGPRS